MISTSILKTTINAELKAHGFLRKGSNWYLSCEEVVVVVNLQKSNYSALYFLNLGFWLQQVEQMQYPRSEQCHIHNRASSLYPDGNPRIADLLNVDEFPYDEDQRITEIQQFISVKLIPLLLKGSTVSGLKKMLSENSGYAIRVVAQECLGLEMN
ncbi:MAG: DUF4304 domain-containing protein [Planctomycetes bacterium]|nr:DUF4304 domain-containing protein [Planctomycetota bacterium]MCH9726115.1 DUF4304 domain-containing protein [Planctomycetota bacterium]MCH9777267.1 DUF4304 domain-containing protein [Planctomycetota bacterium]MCH9792881.1 DUF4304 domain-containing protein [Planctomycetota bacterium]MDF1744651.1 DUF4304 domain-containing protein [Gimesia sp.]